MSELTYDDFKSRVNIQDLLVDAGYRLNRRDGMRYPSYVRIGSDGKRVRGDKFIVTANGLCCFQPPEIKNYNVISFIKEHPNLFAEYRPGMSTDRLVNLVCNRLLNHPVAERAPRDFGRQRDTRPFDIYEYETHSFVNGDWDSQKRFYPYFQNRGINLQTQRAFSDHFFLATRERGDGKKYTNLSFPLSLAAMPGKEIVGLEERSRPNAEGKTAYKGMAAGSNAAEGLWIARLENNRSDMGFTRTIGAAQDVYWFESAFDAMAYYQIKMNEPGNVGYHDLANAVYVSTGGSPTKKQFSSMIEHTPEAIHHLCFDRDRAGRMFAVNFALQKDGRVFTSHLTQDKEKLVVTDLTKGFKRHELPMEPFDFRDICDRLGIDSRGIGYEPCDGRYKDWNDQLLDKPMENEETQTRGMRR
jgi:hypothetical protein